MALCKYEDFASECSLKKKTQQTTRFTSATRTVQFWISQISKRVELKNFFDTKWDETIIAITKNTEGKITRCLNDHLAEIQLGRQSHRERNCPSRKSGRPPCFESKIRRCDKGNTCDCWRLSKCVFFERGQRNNGSKCHFIHSAKLRRRCPMRRAIFGKWFSNQQRQSKSLSSEYAGRTW